MNKKLAEWAFPNATSIDDMGDHLWVHHPFGSKHTLGSLSVDFESLDACFKWLEKPLVDYFIHTTSTEGEYRRAYYDFLCKWLADYIWDEPHKASLALCLSIEKLIDKEAKDD